MLALIRRGLKLHWRLRVFLGALAVLLMATYSSTFRYNNLLQSPDGFTIFSAFVIPLSILGLLLAIRPGRILYGACLAVAGIAFLVSGSSEIVSGDPLSPTFMIPAQAITMLVMPGLVILANIPIMVLASEAKLVEGCASWYVRPAQPRLSRSERPVGAPKWAAPSYRHHARLIRLAMLLPVFGLAFWATVPEWRYLTQFGVVMIIVCVVLPIGFCLASSYMLTWERRNGVGVYEHGLVLFHRSSSPPFQVPAYIPAGAIASVATWKSALFLVEERDGTVYAYAPPDPGKFGEALRLLRPDLAF